MFKINTEKELLSLLRIVSEEAVIKSRKSLKESSDNYASSFKNKLNNELDTLFEQEEEVAEEEPAAEEVAEEEPAAEEEAAAEEVEDEEVEDVDAEEDLPAAEKALSLDGEDVGYSFDSVMTAINTLRAGRSLRDKEIKTELNDYYDRLDDNERHILFLFLKELSKILTGAVAGDEAQDPSDPKYYFDIVKRNEDDSGSAPEESGEEQAAAEEEDQAPVADTEGEDTSPPIKVNESQDLRAIRRKVQQLMRD